MADAAVVESAPPRVRCSFCGKSQEAVRRMIEGPAVYICNECIEHSKNIVDLADHDGRPAVSSESESLLDAINGGWGDFVEAEYALRNHLAALEADRGRVDWLLKHWLLVTANPTGIHPQEFDLSDRKDIDDLIARVDGKSDATLSVKRPSDGEANHA